MISRGFALATVTTALVFLAPTAAFGTTATGPGPTITCVISIAQPHKSTHVPGTVNVVGKIDCTSAVFGMDIGVDLYRNGNLVSYSGIKTNFGKAHIQNSAAETCHTATYRGKVSPWDVVFPEGYTPPSADGVLWGPTNTINKC